MDEAKLMARECVKFAPRFEVKSGNWLFSYLPFGSQNRVFLSPINPFYRDMSEEQIAKWIKDYLILDGKRITKVHIREYVIWEAE